MRLIDADQFGVIALQGKSEEFLEGMLFILDKIYEAPTIEPDRPHGEWIPCSERLPKESLKSVIGWDRFRERCVFVQYMDGHFQITGKQESFDIIAWMPLPEPYKREGEKNE